jgi:dTDP-4-amino-4,6-dideoxy-D-galactose acyltransferase
MASYEILDWDTHFFGFTVAKIVIRRFDRELFGKCIAEMRNDNVKLAYWGADPHDNESQSCAQLNSGFLADRKVTYAMDCYEVVNKLNFDGVLEVAAEEYCDVCTTPELEQLALQAGVFSRFKFDTKIPNIKFEELYRLWIKRSVMREIADIVYVVRHEGVVVGMVTVGEKNGRADIGLIAVDASIRGKGAGKALVLAAMNWGMRKGFTSAQVVTQGENVPACKFYEKCGFIVDKVENIYHFWIGQ